MDKVDETAGCQETQAGNKERTSATQELRVSFGIALTFAITSITAGILIGHIRSPKWDNRVEVAKFINSHYTAQFLAEGRDPERNPIEVRFLLDDRCLVYRTDTDEIKDEEPTAKEVEEQSKTRSWRRENQSLINEGFALGGPVAAFLTKVHVPFSNKAAVVGVCAVTVLVSGVVLGYYITYEPNPDYSSKPFQEMRSNKERWRQLALDYRNKKASQGPYRLAPSVTP